MTLPFLNVDHLQDCASIKQRLGEFEEAKKYSIDYRVELDAAIGILQQRLQTLGCD